MDRLSSISLFYSRVEEKEKLGKIVTKLESVKKMAEEFECQLVEAMGSSEGIAPLGVDATGSTYRFEEHIRDEARDLLQNEQACVSAVDFALELLLRYRGDTLLPWNILCVEKAI
jgi:hypothetical protein